MIAKQIINILHKEYGISAHRTIIANDIDEPKKFLLDVDIMHAIQSNWLIK